MSSPVPAETAASNGAGNILSGEHWTRQPIEPRTDDADSSYEEDIVSSTASLSSSILEYRTIQGRTFHSERSWTARYWGPNDERQNECMDIIHHLLTLVMEGKLFRAPLDGKKIQKVLDVGTGTGMWAIDFADAHPHAEVIGTDISPIQPSWVPPNLRFEIEDATQPWTFRPGSFDLVHMRYLFGSIADWAELFRQAYRVLRPGGYVESFEADAHVTSEDGSIAAGSPLDQWAKVFAEGGKKFGRSFLVVEEDLQRKGLEAAGFTNLVEWNFNCPMTGWPADRRLRELGEYCHLSMEQDLEGMILYTFKQIMGWSTEEIHAYIAHLRRQLRDKSVHPIFKLRCIYAQKPADAPPAPDA
ncbi:hypothetical protein VTK56DRAFT_2207 [Thermocarpiscus australiensis]